MGIHECPIRKKRHVWYWTRCTASFTTYVLDLIGSCISWLSLSLFEEHAGKTQRAHRRSWVDFDGVGLQKSALVDFNTYTKPFVPSLLFFFYRSLQDSALYVRLTSFYLCFFLLDTSLGILRLERGFYEHISGGLPVACLRRLFMDLKVSIPRCVTVQSITPGSILSYKRRLYRGRCTQKSHLMPRMVYLIL